ncbi:hypothetical protein B2M20_10820 [Nitrobacter vulgaris]|uniref:Uncharacterized protein n=1 Tax=Nitrobacter vulgaris TaxID=29421 RepID=A0A1V4HXS7_NITVU|nr:hypothetical protein B2M20_10820 [Nitrobacter vulgaris]
MVLEVADSLRELLVCHDTARRLGRAGARAGVLITDESCARAVMMRRAPFCRNASPYFAITRFALKARKFLTHEEVYRD